MKARIALITLLSLSMSGCATVDLVNVGGNTTASSVSGTSNDADSENVVKLAAGRLFDIFTRQGWVESKDNQRVQSAASVLLRGLETPSDETQHSSYASKSLSVSQMHADVITAQSHVLETSNAAQVYLAVVADDANLREELASLQKALIVAREAELMFKDAIPVANPDLDPVFLNYSDSVDTLRDVTDVFGDRVRSARTLTSAMRAEIN